MLLPMYSLLSFMLQYRINVGQSHVEERKVGTQPKGRQKKGSKSHQEKWSNEEPSDSELPYSIFVVCEW
jgi:hypothetical protein